ncbi:type 1 glutamine amidotransferase [Nostoc sp. XA010]|uniref:type 1 glutamine amidotransferase n=1 Tax=Nostoc sp. XA010 TaxID=2780407 RepID=UPI001E363D83|nr:type 1 glutamine amidotransferase [Nostoc sp. XA010]MCC5661371.1 type 1 glutamine amidotransferase [Nostoc sp. XA010]
MNILAVQNFSLTPPGVLGECVKERGSNLDILLPAEGDELPDNSTDFDGLIILGGPMHANDTTHPLIQGMIGLIHQFYADQKPILGVCLGAQVIAKAFGANVYKHHEFEIGFTRVFSTYPITKEDLLLRRCPETIYMMQWHFDTFDLPQEATLLMSGDVCRHQAYRIGNNIYGFQFHLEVTKQILQNWIETKDKSIENNYPNFSEQLTQQIEKYLEASVAFCRQVGNAWLDLVATRIANS